MRLLVPLLVLLAGCGTNSLDWEDTYNPNNQDPGLKPPPDPGPPPEPPPAQDCSWPLGSYTLTSAMCGANQHNDWSSAYTNTLMVVSHNKNRGCDVVVTLQSDACKEELTLWVDPKLEDEADPSAHQVVFRDNPNDQKPYGTTACTPFECKQKFREDLPCQTNQQLSDMYAVVDQTDPSKLVFSHFLGFAGPTCTNTLKLTFQKQ